MRPSEYLATAMRDIRRQPVRSVLTILTIAISSALFVSLVSLGIDGRNSIMRQLTQGNTLQTLMVSSNGAVGGGLFSSSVQVAQESTEKIDDETVKDLARIPHVTSATGQAGVFSIARFRLAGSSTMFTGQVIAPSLTPRSPELVAGRWFASSQTSPQVIIGNAYARELAPAEGPKQLIGKDLILDTREGYRGVGAEIPKPTASKSARDEFNRTRTTLRATIVGVTGTSISDNQVFIPLGWARKIESPRAYSGAGLTSEDSIAKNGYSTVRLQVDSPDNVERVTAGVARVGFGASGYQRQIEQLDRLSVVLWIVLGAVALLSLFSSSLGVVNVLLMSVHQQRDEISIWRAVGATRSSIARLVLTQAALLGVVGAAIGTGTGYAISRLINAKLQQMLATQGLQTLTLPTASPYLLGISVGLTTALAMLAGLYPAFHAARRSTRL